MAHAAWHRPLGRAALLWGAVIGTLPDLDVIAFPWMDQVERLYWHRGPSHGILFVLTASWLIGLGLARWYRDGGLSRVRAVTGAWFILATHVAIDLFTVYGTQVLAPFSRHGFGTNNLFIIDPLYTLPLLVGIAVAVWRGRHASAQRAIVTALVVSTAYIAWSFVAQARAERVFLRERERQGIAADVSQTSATLANTFLWRHLARVEGGFVVGYWSWFDPSEEVQFAFVPQQADLVRSVRATPAFAAIDWFSQGYWVAEQGDEALRLSDLRFGEIRPAPGAPPRDWGYVFNWWVGPEARNPEGLVPATGEGGSRGASARLLWRRIWGDRTAW